VESSSWVVAAYCFPTFVNVVEVLSLSAPVVESKVLSVCDKAPVSASWILVDSRPLV